MRVVIDHIEENNAMIERSDGLVVNMSKKLIPPQAKEGDVLLIEVDTQSTVDRGEEITSLMETLWEEGKDR